jgi:hypothetical protein
MPGYIPFTATSASVSSTDDQEIICTSFIDDNPNLSSRFGGAYVYGVAGGSSTALLGIQRQLRRNPMGASTGTLYVTRPFASTPASGQKWELYFRFPAIRDEATGRDGYRELINEALRTMRIVPNDMITVSGVTDQTDYLLTYPWIREPGRIVNVRNADQSIYSGGWTPRMIGGQSYLKLDTARYSTGDTFLLEVRRPANSLLKVSGTWNDQTSLTAGLSADTDEAVPSINDVVAVARELCYAELQRNAPEAEARMWAAKEQEAGVAAAALKFVRQEPTEPYLPLRISSAGDLGAFR